MNGRMFDDRHYACFVCDYWPILAAVLLICVAATWIFSNPNQTWALPISTPTPETTEIPITTSTPVILKATSTLLPTINSTMVGLTPTNARTVISPMPDKPEMIFVAIPVNWGGDIAEFRVEAERQVNLFFNESGIRNYFQVRLIVLDEGLKDVSLADRNLVYDIIEFGASKEPADRYIGITDQDLAPEGNSSIAGWTQFFGQGIIAENQEEITAHELGHTYGLCDEYSYKEWEFQNEALSGGCPNPFPTTCEATKFELTLCEGTPTEDGDHSLMAAAGSNGRYGFNQSCMQHLTQTWIEMRESTMPR